MRERREEIAPLAEYFVRTASEANGSEVTGLEPDALALLERWTWPGNVRDLRNAIERAVVVARGDRIAAHDLPERVRTQSTLDPAASQAADAPLPPDATFKERVQRFEAAMIIEALGATAGNQTEAAKRLGMPLRTLVHKLKTLGIKKLGYGRDAE